MGSMRLVFPQGVGVLAIALALGGQAHAQDAARPGTQTGGQTRNTGGTPAASAGVVDMSQGGVGGTGLGKTPPGSSDGTGMSVKGPPGQGAPQMQMPQ